MDGGRQSAACFDVHRQLPATSPGPIPPPVRTAYLGSSSFNTASVRVCTWSFS